jgi:hypothetical protein
VKTIAFFVRQFSERGTEVSIYDYAHYNEKILKNKSYIVCFTRVGQEKAGLPLLRHSYGKFDSRFTIIEIESIEEMPRVIGDYSIDFFYTQTPGGKPLEKDIYEFNNRNIYGNCKTIKHCIFDYSYPESDFHSGISNYLNRKYGTNIPVVPYMIGLPDVHGDLKEKLNIPHGAFVYGRYGGKSQFDISYVHTCIKKILSEQDDVYFLFMNTDKFHEHQRIIHLDCEIDLARKVEFINTCDVMIHARSIGETFGAAIGEFSSRNKPVITCNCGDKEHLELLSDKAIVYGSEKELMEIFRSIRTIISHRSDWNAFKAYTPENIMELFEHAYLVSVQK